MITEGYYPAKITSAVLDQVDGGLMMCFCAELTMPDGSTAEATPRHFTFGPHGWSGKAVAELFGIEWPNGIREIGKVEGRECEVQIKHKERKGGGEPHENAYIVTRKKIEQATKDQIDAALAKLEAEAQDDTPF